MEHAAFCNAVIRLVFLTACARTELCQALQHHPDSPYGDRSEHPVADHVDALRRSADEAGAIIAALRSDDLPSEQRRQVRMYVEACERYLNQGLIPACDALAAGDYQEANRHLHCKVAPVPLDPLDEAESAGQAGEAEQTLVNLSVILGLSIAASTLWVGTHSF